MQPQTEESHTWMISHVDLIIRLTAAYMYGFGSNKRIVLYDTLLKQANEEQVVAVLAHELVGDAMCGASS